MIDMMVHVVFSSQRQTLTFSIKTLRLYTTQSCWLSRHTMNDTIYTKLKRNKGQMNALGQQYTPIVFAIGILTKDLGIVWSRSDELSGVIPISWLHAFVNVYICKYRLRVR